MTMWDTDCWSEPPKNYPYPSYAAGPRSGRGVLDDDIDRLVQRPIVKGQDWLLVHCRVYDGQYAFYRAHAPTPVPLANLVAVAGTRLNHTTTS